MNKKKRTAPIANMSELLSSASISQTITAQTIVTPRLTFHLRQRGPADGIPMLLIHGSFATSRWWEPLMRVLPDEILAIAPDLRGCGGSDRSAYGYTIAEQAEDI